MKASRCSLLLAALLLAVSSHPAAAADSEDEFENNGLVVADVLIARPLCFAMTVAGAGLFVASLPIAAISRSVHTTARALVGWPAHETFVRKLGDFSDK